MLSCLTVTKFRHIRLLPWRNIDKFNSTTIFALHFQLVGLNVGFGCANDDAAYDKHLADHMALNSSNLDGMVVTANDHLPVLLKSHVLFLMCLKIFLDSLLHESN